MAIQLIFYYFEVYFLFEKNLIWPNQPISWKGTLNQKMIKLREKSQKGRGRWDLTYLIFSNLFSEKYIEWFEGHYNA